jgi:hypothetical protein
VVLGALVFELAAARRRETAPVVRGVRVTA